MNLVRRHDRRCMTPDSIDSDFESYGEQTELATSSSMLSIDEISPIRDNGPWPEQNRLAEEKSRHFKTAAFSSKNSSITSDLYSSDDDREIEESNLSLLSGYTVERGTPSRSFLGKGRAPFANIVSNSLFQETSGQQNGDSRRFRRCAYLGSTKTRLLRPNASRAAKIAQTQEAIGQIKSQDHERQPMTAVDVIVEKRNLIILESLSQHELMQFPLPSISYVADYGDLLILTSDDSQFNFDQRTEAARCTCHVLQSSSARMISNTLGCAFQRAYEEMQPSCEQTIEEVNFVEDYGCTQARFCQEVNFFTDKANKKEIFIPKLPGEKVGITIVESGWGSIIPTAMVGHLQQGGPAQRCGLLNVGDYIISVNGVSCVGLPLRACLAKLKAMKAQRNVRLVIVKCPPVIDVYLRRPDPQYPLGFGVQEGVVCSLMRGGIAERGGVRVGHRIIDLNDKSLVALPHEKIVNMLANAVGELRMRTMPAKLYRLLIGKEKPKFV